MSTVRELQQILSTFGPSDEVATDAQTSHSSDSTGIYLRVSVKAGGVEVLNMLSDTREEFRL